MRTNSQFTTMVHVLTLLAKVSRPLSSTQIAGSVNTNPVIIRQVVGRLRDAELVETIPGSTGGATLKKNPAQITLKEVYQLTKKETFFGLHPNVPNPRCPVGRNIQGVLIEVFAQMDALVEDALAQISIADIVEQVSHQEMERSKA